jgi:arsenate reductase (thioredoxin)
MNRPTKTPTHHRLRAYNPVLRNYDGLRRSLIIEESVTVKPKRVLILCTGNSARSQMTEGLLRAQCGHEFEVFSAGTAPSRVNPLAIEAMREVGIDISAQRSKSVEEFIGQAFDYVITVCDQAKESCPIFPGKAQCIHWSIDDPAAAEGDEAARLTAFRRARDTLREHLQGLFGR